MYISYRVGPNEACVLSSSEYLYQSPNTMEPRSTEQYLCIKCLLASSNNSVWLGLCI